MADSVTPVAAVAAAPSARAAARSARAAARSARWWILALVVFGLGACSAVGVTPSASMTTTTPGVTERWFKLEWNVTPELGGTSTVDGDIYNASGRCVSRVQLLVQELDASGALVGQRLEWLPGPLPAGERAYFKIAHLPGADQYRVSIWSYDAFDRPRRRF